ncbi:hypothetical protein CAPTEDRAFT_68077, partial [Capitella teleta]
CPHRCKCLGRTIICNDLNWSIVQLLSGAIRAFTNRHSIGKQENAALLSMKQLLYLNLKHGSIKSLPPGPNSLFRNQGRLLYLDLSHNQIESLPQKCFFGLMVLKSINLQHNP